MRICCPNLCRRVAPAIRGKTFGRLFVAFGGRGRIGRPEFWSERVSYKRTYVGRDHPHADARGRIMEHRRVWLDAGRELGPDDVLHHRDGDPTNNALANLERMSRAAHARLHAEQRRIERLRKRFAGWKVDSSGRPYFDGETACE